MTQKGIVVYALSNAKHLRGASPAMVEAFKKAASR